MWCCNIAFICGVGCYLVLWLGLGWVVLFAGVLFGLGVDFGLKLLLGGLGFSRFEAVLVLFAGVLGFGEFVGWCCICGFLWVLISCRVGAALLLVWVGLGCFFVLCVG